MRTRKLLVLGLSTLAALALSECAARRLFPPPEFVRGLQLDPVLGFRTKPGLELEGRDETGAFPWRTNALGFLGPEPPAAGEPKAGQRLLFLGDSFLHVWNVRLENAMPEVSARLLTEAGTPALAWNLSCNGWSTAQELLALREYGARIRPDAVVLALYASNDVATNEIALAQRTRLGAADFLNPYLVFDPRDPRAAPKLRWSQPARSFLRRHSRLVARLELWSQVLASERELDWLLHSVEQPSPAERSGISPVEQLEFLRGHAGAHPWEQAWTTTEALVVRAAREARELGARFVLLVIPHVVQVQRDARAVALDTRARRLEPRGLDATHDWNGAEKRLARLASEHELEVVFLLERLRARARAGALAYQPDGHLNTLGQHVAAEALVERLRAVAPTAEPVPSGAPVDVLGELPRRLEASAGGAERLLGRGWEPWSADACGCGPGWLVARDAELVLRGGPGTLVLRGSLPAQANLPVRVRARVGRRWHADAALDQGGPFELRVPVEGPPEGEPVLIELGTTRVFRPGPDRREFGAVVHAIGFEE